MLNDSYGVKIGIVQNEFAPANIDGNIIKREVNRDFELLEFNNGSIFCVCLLSGFIEGLKSFAQQHQPDVILIETSGMSDPIAVGEIFSSEKDDLFYLASVTSIVDASNFLKVHCRIPQIKNQLMVADNIIINKIDLSNNTDEIKSKIKQLNPTAEIVETTFCNIPLEKFEINPKINLKPKLFPQFQSINTGQTLVKSAILKTAKAIDDREISGFMKSLQNIAYRSKGYLLSNQGKVYSVQGIMDQIEVDLIEATSQRTEIIAIGEGMTVKVLKNLYNNFVTQQREMI